MSKLSKRKHELRLKLYELGLNDVQMAYVLGCSTSAIYYWRKRNGLEVNKKKFSHRLDIRKEKLRLFLYNLGLNDTEIAKAIGCKVSTIRRWRASRGLASHYDRKKLYRKWRKTKHYGICEICGKKFVKTSPQNKKYCGKCRSKIQHIYHIQHTIRKELWTLINLGLEKEAKNMIDEIIAEEGLTFTKRTVGKVILEKLDMDYDHT